MKSVEESGKQNECFYYWITYCLCMFYLNVLYCSMFIAHIYLLYKGSYSKKIHPISYLSAGVLYIWQ